MESIIQEIADIFNDINLCEQSRFEALEELDNQLDMDFESVEKIYEEAWRLVTHTLLTEGV